MRAAEVPLRIAEAAADVSELAALAAAEGKPALRPDAAAAATLAEAAVRAAPISSTSISRPFPATGARPRRPRSPPRRRRRARAPWKWREHRLIPAWSLTAEAAESDRDRLEWPERVTRDWAIEGATGEGVDVCILDSGVDGDHTARRRHRERRGRESSTARTTQIVPDEVGDVCGHGTRLRRDRPLARTRLPHPQRPGARRGQHGQRRPDPRRPRIRDRAGLQRRQHEPLDDEAQVRGGAARTGRRRVFPAERCSSPRRTTCRSRATRGGSRPSSPSGATRARTLGSGTRTRIRPSSSSRVDSTSTSPGPAARRSAAPGNSFAAPHIAGLSALVLSKHPSLTPFQLKSVLYLTASNTGGSE